MQCNENDVFFKFCHFSDSDSSTSTDGSSDWESIRLPRRNDSSASPQSTLFSLPSCTAGEPNCSKPLDNIFIHTGGFQRMFCIFILQPLQCELDAHISSTISPVTPLSSQMWRKSEVKVTV